MTKKHYVLLASILHEASQYMSEKQFSTVLDHACNLLEKDNPLFKRIVFRREAHLPRTFVNRTLREG